MSGTIAFITMGCAKNEVDTSDMADALSAAGFNIVEDAGAADVVIVNTCSFIQSATEESIAAILDAAELPNMSAGAKLVVAGCMPARYGSQLESELPEAAAFVPCGEEAGIAHVVSGLLCEGICAADQGERPASCAQARGYAGYDVREGAQAYFVYIKISDGCDRWCSYCTIPKIRGRYHSFSREQICADVRRGISRGAREIVLVAQDTGRWGSDFAEPDSLAGLLEHLADSFPEVCFRVMYIQPEGVTDDLLDVMAAKANICDYLDIPLQHVSRHILHDMNRQGSAEEFTALFDRIRSKVPDVALRTTLIAGFPGETEVDVQELLAFVEDAPFDYIGVFPYSREEGTRAYDLPDQIDQEEKDYRAQRLRDVADAVCAANISRRIGTKARVLVEGRESDGQLFGRSAWQAPEVDGITFIDSGQPGEYIDITIDDTLFYDMEGSICDG